MKEILSKKSCFFILFLSFIFLSCNFSTFFSTEKVIFTMDKSEETNKAKKIQRVIFIDDKYLIHELTENQLDFSQQCFSLLLTQNQLTPVLVYFENEPFPYGAIYPYSTEFSKHQGFSSRILFRFLNETQTTNKNLLRKHISFFNWEKFNEKVKTYENPWDLNQEILLEALAGKTFSAKSFQLLQLE